jgi:bifunctional non-homologous end joining protein LigD
MHAFGPPSIRAAGLDSDDLSTAGSSRKRRLSQPCRFAGRSDAAFHGMAHLPPCTVWPSVCTGEVGNMTSKEQVNVDGHVVPLTNTDKVLYPRSGFTKAQVIDYYLRVSQWILPHLRGRPVTLKRFPDGVAGKAFYEKNASRSKPDWVRKASVPRHGGGAAIQYVVIDDRATLAWCANMASLELHPFLHRADALEKPTSVVFDLDPGEGVTVIATARLALVLRDVLARVGLKSFAKFSGSKGIQVFAPLNTQVTYGQTQPFARAVAEWFRNEHPDLIVFEMTRTARAGKVFIDWSQNSDFKTTVAVYSLRAKADPPCVSLPVTWDEMEAMVHENDTERFCLWPADTLTRLEKVGDVFEPVLTLKQKLPEFAQKGIAAKVKATKAKKRR